MTPRRRQPRFRAMAVAVGAATASLVLVLVLVVQHYRHEWPFSLHHALAPATRLEDGARVAAPADDGRDRHPRAAIDLDARAMAAADIAMEPARTETLSRTVRAVATVVPDETRISHVHTRVAGWVEELFVAATGEQVRKGQPLAAIFSQDLYASQVEYLAAVAQAGAGPSSAVASSARARLNVLGMSEAEIAAIEASDQPHRLVTVTAPRDGVVLRRGISAGTAVDPSTELLTLADLSTVWVVAELPEAEMRDLVPGMPVAIDLAGSAFETLEATVDFIYPTLSERTRTTRVRMVVDNLDGRLRPGMYGSARFRSPPRPALTVPRDAVVDTGSRQHVFVAVGDMRFEPRQVTLGVRLPGRIEILDGVVEGEEVVSSGVFLLDSESRLRSVGGTGHAGHGATSPAPEPQPRDDAGHPDH